VGATALHYLKHSSFPVIEQTLLPCKPMYGGICLVPPPSYSRKR